MTVDRAEPRDPASADADDSVSTGRIEPAVLGAAATLPAQRRRDRRREPRGRRHDDAPARQHEARRDGQARSDGFSDVEYVFEADAINITPLGPYLRSLWERRQFMLALARSEARSKRSNAALGALWSLLDPLLQAFLYFMLFSVIRGGQRPMEFLPVLIGSMFLFRMVMSGFGDGGKSIKKSKGLLLNSSFPRALFPLTTVCREVMTLPPAVAVTAVFHIALGPPLSWSLLLLPVLFALQVLLMVGVSLLMSTLLVYFKDAENAVQYVSRLMFFITPVIYPVTLLNDSMRAVLSWQPFFALFSSYQAILDGRAPTLWQVVQVMLWAVVLLVVGLRTFRRHEHEFAMRL